ncbi:MAG TPA: tRNA (adenosine(37)-N6)-threonylcarbamoyltransferase complex dimerization subunit type 1 TsaB [Candidatus Limnocylindrales bacterium]|nr:tRNA (adenosine(37)-N6)-threonylcarbamoyltransferase complex dimerization subunit type 1 TsaB [Candidatus Limnocylindrales bacterium]
MGRSASGPAGAPWLAFDTSGAQGSVALGRVSAEGLEVLSHVAIEERMEQAARLVPAIDEALRAAGIERTGLAGIAVGEGPGSFTGVRVAAATAKGLTHALELPLRAVSSLAAAALAHDAGGVRYVLFDARADRVYGACYGVGRAGLQELAPPHPGTLRDVLAGDLPAGVVFVGDGALRHRAVIEAAGYPVDPGDGTASLAVGLLRYVALDPGGAPVADLSSWEPAYVRATRAEPHGSTTPWST